jgi:hypothetical protein
MKEIGSAWLPLAVGVAVVLWLAATVLDSSLQEEPGPVAPTGAEVVEDQPDEPDEDFPAGNATNTKMSCAVTEEHLKTVIDDARYCVVDDDCTLFDYGYPLDCMTSIAKSEIPLLREEYRKYDENCEFRVFYDCPTEPYVRLALCRDNRCVVELDRRDDLQDSTLERMNRQGPRRE